MNSMVGGIAAAVLLTLTACSGGSTSDMDPAEAREKLTEQGMAITPDGLRSAVDLKDADAVGMYIAAGFDRSALMDALSYAPTIPGDSNNPKLPGPIEANYADPAYRGMLQVMFDAGLTPNDTLFANDNNGRGFSNFNTSLIAEGLRIGDADFLDFLAKQDSDWTAPPRCYGENPNCERLGTLSSWLFYIPMKAGKVWSLDDSIAAIERLRALNPGGGENRPDPYLKAILAYRHMMWSPDEERIAALWREAGSPQPILPDGWTVEHDVQKQVDPNQSKSMRAWAGISNSARMSRQAEYLRGPVYLCLSEREYEACLANPPPREE